MKTSIQRFSRRVVNRVRRQLGYQAKPRPFTDYIVFNETVAAAKAVGLSVGQYIERATTPASAPPSMKPWTGWPRWACSSI